MNRQKQWGETFRSQWLQRLGHLECLLWKPEAVVGLSLHGQSTRGCVLLYSAILYRSLYSVVQVLDPRPNQGNLVLYLDLITTLCLHQSISHKRIILSQDIMQKLLDSEEKK